MSLQLGTPPRFSSGNSSRLYNERERAGVNKVGKDSNQQVIPRIIDEVEHLMYRAFVGYLFLLAKFH